MVDIADIPTGLIDPSPYQARKRFIKIEELAKSIQDFGLIEPIIVRPMSERWELIVGERRWRATKLAKLETILAIVRDVGDSMARRMTFEENTQRDDLTRIEEIDGWILHVDAELWRDEEYRNYAEMNGWPDEFDDQQARLRARWLLGKLKAEMESNYVNFLNKFIQEIDIIFSQHPRNMGWRSFLNNDIPLLDLPEPVLEMAIEKNLNKSQTKALGKIVKSDPREAQKILDTGKVSVRGELGFPEKAPIEEASAREIERPFHAQSVGDVIATKWTGDWESYTPAIYIEAARSVMGSIDCDPASNDQAQETVQAKVYYTPESDGLAQKWEGNIFLNPPYSHPEVAHFVDKLLDELKDGQQAILLTNNNTDAGFFHKAANKASALCFTKGRINFLKPDGNKSYPTNGQVFYYFGNNLDRFIEVFSEFGLLMRMI